MKRFLTLVSAGALALAVSSVFGEEAKLMTIAALYKQKTQLVGKSVSVRGKVVKVNNSIMGRNWVHLQDGTGDKSTNDLTVTSNQTAAVGDQITITGKVVIDKDFGAGYAYPVLVEEASIKK